MTLIKECDPCLGGWTIGRGPEMSSLNPQFFSLLKVETVLKMVTVHVFTVEEQIVIASYHQFCWYIDLAKHIESGPELVQGSRASQISTMNQDIRRRQRFLEG
jgi:hypothetical protein